jgi:hypothetical protein
MRNLRFASGVIVVALVAASCNGFGGFGGFGPSTVGSGNAVTQQRTVGGFTDVRVGTAVKATIIVGSDTSVSVTADDNIVDHVQTNVVAGRLDVSINGSVMPKTPVSAAITTPSLNAVEATSAANVTATGVNTDDLRASSDSAASLTVRGNATSVELTADSAASADLGGVPAQDAKVTVSAAARATVNAQLSVTGSVQSAGVVNVEGSPASVNVTTESGGVVNKD